MSEESKTVKNMEHPQLSGVIKPGERVELIYAVMQAAKDEGIESFPVNSFYDSLGGYFEELREEMVGARRNLLFPSANIKASPQQLDLSMRFLDIAVDVLPIMKSEIPHLRVIYGLNIQVQSEPGRPMVKLSQFSPSLVTKSFIPSFIQHFESCSHAYLQSLDMIYSMAKGISLSKKEIQNRFQENFIKTCRDGDFLQTLMDAFVSNAWAEQSVTTVFAGVLS